MAAVALDQLLLAGDRLGLRLDVLDRPGVALVRCRWYAAVVAAKRRQPAVAQLPDAGHGRVEECPVVRRDEQRARPAAEVLLEPFERVEVEVVRRLVEQQQVGIGDDQPGQRGAGLLAARQRRWRLGPLVAREAETGQRASRPAGRACSRRGPRTRGAGRRRPARRRGRRARARPAARPSRRGARHRSGPPSAGRARP